MGYARLHFPNNATVLITHVLYDIVGVLTGTFTNTNQLQTATQSLSQIVNTQSSNWSFLFPASHSTKANSVGVSSWVLSAPCVNGAKTKYIRLTSMANSAVPTVGSGSQVLYDVTFGNSNLQAGLAMQSATAASSSTALTNPTWLSTAASTNGTAFTSNFIYLHWSQRHCLIYGGMSSDLTKGFIASFEHQETGITTTRGTAPVVHLVYSSTNGTWDSTASGPASSAKLNVCQVLNHFAPSTATTTGLYNLLSSINSQQNDMPLVSDAASGAYPSTTTKNSSGALARFVQPIYWHQHHLGVTHQYVSQLSNVFRTAPSMGQEGDSVTIGNDTYIYLPTTYNTYNLLVRRA